MNQEAKKKYVLNVGIKIKYCVKILNLAFFIGRETVNVMMD